MDIIICEKCNGKGFLSHKELTNYHHGYHEEWSEQCSKCEGSGRLVIEIIKKPYIQEETKERNES